MPTAAVATKANPLMGGSAAASASDVEAIARLGAARKKLKEEIAKAVVGQEHIVDQLLTALFARGHCLMIGVPGLAKTLMVRTIASAIDLKFNRIQFTPDLMPSDITGTEIIEEDRATGGRQFRFVHGPVFANILLADEINRTPPKTQAALLQAMQENEVTVGGRTYRRRSSYWQRKILSSRKALIRCRKPSSTASCSTSASAIPSRTKN
jgi:MoxR-like ATPase